MSEVQRRLGALYRTLGLIDHEQLEQALAMQQAQGVRLGRSLAESGGFDERSATELVSERLNLDAVDPAKLSITEEVLAAIPEAMAKELCILPVSFDESPEGTVMTCATSDPLDPAVLSRVRAQIGGLRVRWVLAGEQALQAAIDRHYGSTNGHDPIQVDFENSATGMAIDEELAHLAAEETIDSSSSFDAALGEVLEDYMPGPISYPADEVASLVLTDAFDDLSEPDSALIAGSNGVQHMKWTPAPTGSSQDILTGGLGWGALLAADDGAGIETHTAGTSQVDVIPIEDDDRDAQALIAPESVPIGPQANAEDLCFEIDPAQPTEIDNAEASAASPGANLPLSFENTDPEVADVSSEPALISWPPPRMPVAQIALKPMTHVNGMQDDLLLPEIEADAVDDEQDAPDQLSLSELHSAALRDSEPDSLFRRFIDGDLATEEERTQILREVVRVMLEQGLL